MPHPPIIISEVGKGEEKKARATVEGCGQVAEEIKELKPEVIIIITPHGSLFRDAIAITDTPSIQGDLGKFGVPEIQFNIEIDMELNNKIFKSSREDGIMTVPITQASLREYNISSELDHGAMVPLYFVNNEYKNYKLIHITYGMLSKIDLYRFGMIIKKCVEKNGENAVIIASGDLSHKLSNEGPYKYNPHGVEFDKQITKLLAEGDVEGIFNMDKKMIDAAGECGLRSFYIMLGAMDGFDVKGRLLSYEGPFGVGYGVMSFGFKKADNRNFLNRLTEGRNKERDIRRQNEDLLVRLARESLEHYVKEGEYIKVPSYVTEDILNQSRGAFVSLKVDGELRGCIGTIFPATENLAQEITRNAVEAGEKDPRFYPVEEEELKDIEYSVDVLMPPKKASKDELDPKRFGVIVRKGSKAGLLLPDLEGVDGVDEQLEIVLKKAGIGVNEDYSIEKFEVIRHR
jgi:AmmeMemoRadiSam system protein A/AmmeMemoRadiSam system protein B